MSATLYRNTTPTSQAIWIGGGQPDPTYRAGLVVQQSAAMEAGQIALFTAEAEGSIYRFPAGTVKWTFPMFQNGVVVVFEPGAIPKTVNPSVSFYDGGSRITMPIGMNLGVESNDSYFPLCRSGAFQAPIAGDWIFALYMWAGSTLGGTGNAAWVYNGTSQMTVTVLDA